MKKLLAVGVIVLFLGVAIAPSINANIRELSEGIYPITMHPSLYTLLYCNDYKLA